MPKVLVTGAAGGIGRSICEIFSNEGYKVIAVDRKKTGDLPYELLQFDISRLRNSDSACEQFYQHVESIAEGKLDTLVNNAAIQVVKPFKQIKQEDWDISFDTNLLAPFLLSQRFLPMLQAAKGSIVNVASIHAEATKREFTVYATSKGAMVSLTRSLALDLAPEVRVNAVLPAATDTPMLRDGFKDNLEGLDELGAYHPLDRIARAEEVARVVLFLSSSQASFMTGEAVKVDGGIGACLHDPVK